MKKVIAMLALVALVGNVANAELLKNFKYDGKIEVNAWQMNDRDYVETATDKRNDVDTRVQVNMGFDLNADVDAVVSMVKSNRQYGNASDNVDAITAAVTFEQAYLNLKGVLGLDHKLGRQYYGNEGDLNVYFGPRSWPFAANHVGQTNALGVSGLDGWSSAYNYGKWNFGAVFAKADNNQAAGDSDSDLAGITVKYDLMEDLKLGGYGYRYNTQSGSANLGPNDHMDTLGVKADGKFMGFEYNAEVAKNFGLANENVHQAVYGLGNAFYLPNNTTGDYTGMAVKANVKYGIDLMGKLSFMGEYAMGSGDDDATDDEVAGFMTANSDYRPGIIWGGDHLAIGGNGLENLTTFNLGAMWNPSKLEKLTVGAKYFNFSPTEAPAAYDVFGSELDLSAKWQHSENVGVKAYYAMFMPDSDYAATVTAPDSDDTTTVLGAAFTVKF